MNILYVPLDERPCNYKYPQFMAELADNIQLVTPPDEYMGKMKKPADVDSIWEWLFDKAREYSYAIVSVDTLVYGNIINSRIHNRTTGQCISYMNNFIKLKQINPNLEIHAFNLVARVADYDGDEEDPSYWKNYGRKICRYGCLTDKISQCIAQEDEYNELEQLKNSIPQIYLDDFLERREKNRFVNIKSVELTESGIIDFLDMPKDDCSEFGFAAMDQKIIAKEIVECRIMDRVLVHPGADEVGTVLLGRVFNRINHFIPKIYVRYSSTEGPFVIPNYEDRPLHESIKYQITSLGGVLVNSEMESDFLLAVHSPGKNMIEASKQDQRDMSYYTHINMHEFIHYINYYSYSCKKPYAIADIAFSNGSDNEFMVYAKKKGLFDRQCAYGGWNTAQNTLGVVLVHGLLLSYYHSFSDDNGKFLLSSKFLMRKIVTDWINQSNVLYKLLQMAKDDPRLDPFNVGDNTELVLKAVTEIIEQMIKEEFEGVFLGRKIYLSNIELPWNRVFEIDFKLELV